MPQLWDRVHRNERSHVYSIGDHYLFKVQKISSRVCKIEHIHSECPRMIPQWTTSREGSAGPAGASCTASPQTKARSRWGQLFTRAGAANGPAHVFSRLKSEFFWFPVSSWLTAKSLGSRCTLFNTGKLQDSLDSSGAYPSRAMVGRVLNSPVLLLHMWAGPSLAYSHLCNWAQKLLHFFPDPNIISLEQNLKIFY